MVPVPFAPRGRNRAARKQRGTAMTKERFDIHQHITDKIVSAIERGAGDFHLPWHRSAGNIMRPVNIASKKAYRGVNVVALWAYAEEFGYSSGTWGTYKQWSEAGAQVRKGEKAAFVVFYKELEFAADPESGDAETTTHLFARAQRWFSPPRRRTAIRLPSSTPRPRRSSRRSSRPRFSSRRPAHPSTMAAAGPSTVPRRTPF